MLNTAAYVDSLVRQWQAEGKSKTYIVWNVAMACLAWAYVYSAWGAECTPSERRKRYKLCPGHETIKTKCKGFEDSNCSGCQWFPEGQRTRCFDCRGFTNWCLRQIGFDLYGDTCSSQWNCSTNWKAKGEIKTMPRDILCCLFVHKNGKWTHTGFGYNDETLECSVGVQYNSKRASKWTHWAIPVCMDGEVIPPTPAPTPTPSTSKPTIRKGSTGEYVYLAQTQLLSKGYDIGKSGVDGKFGSATESAVKAFQKDRGLKADGIIGPMTWKALDDTTPTALYAVTIPHMTKAKADELLKQYPGAVVVEERGE